jgi:hypothetical protein
VKVNFSYSLTYFIFLLILNKASNAIFIAGIYSVLYIQNK